jgi:hypothetical protein
VGRFLPLAKDFPASAFSNFERLKEGSQLLHESGQEIIRLLAVSDHSCHFEVVTGLPVVVVDTSTTE